MPWWNDKFDGPDVQKTVNSSQLQFLDDVVVPVVVQRQVACPAVDVDSWRCPRPLDGQPEATRSGRHRVQIAVKSALCAGIACGRSLCVVSSGCVGARWFVSVCVCVCVFFPLRTAPHSLQKKKTRPHNMMTQLLDGSQSRPVSSLTCQ